MLDRDESELVEKIVEGITRKLILSSNIGDDLNSLVGIHKRAEKLIS